MVKTEGNIRKSFSLYRKHTEEEKVDVKTYINIANEFNKFLVDKMLEGEEITLPHRMGIMFVIGHKRKLQLNENGLYNLPPDWVATKELRDKSEQAKEERKIVYQLNAHTNGAIFKFFWSKKQITTDNKNLYSLRMSRTNKRTLSARIKSGMEYLIKQ